MVPVATLPKANDAGETESTGPAETANSTAPASTALLFFLGLPRVVRRCRAVGHA